MPDDSCSRELIPHSQPAPPAKKRQYNRRQADLPRVPAEVEGVQSNFCRNINCENFGVAPRPKVSKGRRTGSPDYDGDGYRLIGKKGANAKSLYCTKCGLTSSIKSNAGIVEELRRISTYLESKPEPRCPKAECPNHGIPVSVAGHYQSKGYTTAGSPRWICKSCRTRFSDRKAERKRGRSHKDATIFADLVNKAGIRIMSRKAHVSVGTIYNKIDFIHRRCLAFMADRERRIAGLNLSRLYLCTDRQDYMINWTNRAEKKNVQLTAVATADNRTGYVFGMHSNFDPSLNTEDMEAQAIVAGDFEIEEPAHRRFARFWTSPDFEEARRNDPRAVPSPIAESGDVWMDVIDGYREMRAIPDSEAKERPPRKSMLPAKGCQVHFEYTVHAHYRLLRRMLGPVGKIRFFIDQDDTLRAGCLTAFVEEMRAGTADAFYVKIDKGLNNEQRDEIAGKSAAVIEAHRKALGIPKAKKWDAVVSLVEAELYAMRQLSPRDRWIQHPDGTGGEPLKAVCWLTERTGVPVDMRHLAIVFARASMHSIDRYFMQLRRLVMALERPVHTPSNDGRVWRGYSPYNPAQIQKLLDIYRCYYNFVAVGEDKKTPAMRLGLARGPVRESDILYFGR